MSRLGLALALTLIPSIASAQLPVEQAAEEPAVESAPVEQVAPQVAPTRGPFAAVVAVPPPKPIELQKRFGVAARMVSLGLSDGATDREYAGAGIAASYRINRRWELVLALDALDAPEGPDLHSTSLEARFHLTPYRRWDWYAMAGIGALHEVPPDGDHAHDDGVARGRLHGGIGLARRFRAWSVAAELHSVGVGPQEAMETATARSSATPMATGEGLSGGELTVAATLFF